MWSPLKFGQAFKEGDHSRQGETLPCLAAAVKPICGMMPARGLLFCRILLEFHIYVLNSDCLSVVVPAQSMVSAFLTA
jgi:hypothetical protein